MFSSFTHSSPIMISRYELNSHKATKLTIVSELAVKYHSNKNMCVFRLSSLLASILDCWIPKQYSPVRECVQFRYTSTIHVNCSSGILCGEHYIVLDKKTKFT